MHYCTEFQDGFQFGPWVYVPFYSVYDALFVFFMLRFRLEFSIAHEY